MTPVVLLPVKNLSIAKSRLDLPPAQRQEVARALADHTIRTAINTAGAENVVVVTADSTVRRLALGLRAYVVLDVQGELNAAVELGLRSSAKSHPDAPVMVLVVDLPLLSRADLEAALQRMGETGVACFVPDVQGNGTTSVFVPVGSTVTMRFGRDSARHFQADGLVPMPDVPTSLRADLDTLDDLHAHGMPAA